MYFSKIELLPGTFFNFLKENKHTIYDEHKFIWNLFEEENINKRDFLYRRDLKKGSPVFYTVSERKPSEKFSYVTIQTKPYIPKISTAETYSFSLRVNPVVSRKSESNRNSKHHGVWMDAKKQTVEKGIPIDKRKDFIEQAVKDWLIERGLKNGFETSHDKVAITGHYNWKIFKGKGKKPIVLGIVEYDGILHVTDSSLFRNLLFMGIGKSRSFGAGLMLIRRIE
jgi:CRISPR system Cascade subunit CasE